MKNTLLYLKAGLILVLCFYAFGMAQDEQENVKLAQTGFQFLSVISDARAAAMAGAVSTMDMGSSALFFNPATMARMSGTVDMSASYNEWIADITHQSYSLAVNLSPGTGQLGVVGISVQSVDYGDVIGTRVADNDQGFEFTDVINPSALAVGLGYAKSLSDRFYIGGQIRWVRQDLGQSVIAEKTQIDTTLIEKDNVLEPLAFDFGTLFETGWKSLVFGMSVRNFSSEIEYAEEGFQLPLVFTLGISMDLMDLMEMGGPEQNLFISLNASHYRSHPEQLLIGLDYRLMDILSLRGGYVTNNDENGLSFGFGIQQFGLQLDYSYTPFGIFDNIQRMTARFSL